MSRPQRPPISQSATDRQQQELRIQHYRDQLEFPIPSAFAEYTQEDLDATEGFFRYLLTLEGRPTSTLAKQLIRDGIALPPPDSFTDLALTKKLQEVIAGLAKLRTYLLHTDHLSDRELYEHLWSDTLNEADYELDDDMGQFQTTIDLVGDCSDLSLQLYFRFYADEIDREWWLEGNTGYEMPEMEPTPYDRDQHLPKAPFED